MGEPNAAQLPPAQPVALKPQQAEILLKADLANLARKVQQGKTLSVAGHNLVQSILGGGDASTVNFADNQVELAKILNCDRRRSSDTASSPAIQGRGTMGAMT